MRFSFIIFVHSLYDNVLISLPHSFALIPINVKSQALQIKFSGEGTRFVTLLQCDTTRELPTSKPFDFDPLAMQSMFVAGYRNDSQYPLPTLTADRAENLSFFVSIYGRLPQKINVSLGSWKA